MHIQKTWHRSGGRTSQHFDSTFYNILPTDKQAIWADETNRGVNIEITFGLSTTITDQDMTSITSTIPCTPDYLRRGAVSRAVAQKSFHSVFEQIYMIKLSDPLKTGLWSSENGWNRSCSGGATYRQNRWSTKRYMAGNRRYRQPLRPLTKMRNTYTSELAS